MNRGRPARRAGSPRQARGALVGPAAGGTRHAATARRVARSARPGERAAWRADRAPAREFLAVGREGLQSRSQPTEDRELSEAQCKIGEQAMEIDTPESASGEEGGPLSRRGARSERAAASTVQGGLTGGRRVSVGGAGSSAGAARLGRGLSPPSPRAHRSDDRPRAAPSDSSGARRLAILGRGPPQGVCRPAPPRRPQLAQARPPLGRASSTSTETPNRPRARRDGAARLRRDRSGPPSTELYYDVEETIDFLEPHCAFCTSENCGNPDCCLPGSRPLRAPADTPACGARPVASFHEAARALHDDCELVTSPG